MSSAYNGTVAPVQYFPSVNTPDFPTPPWAINQAQADALYAANVPLKYWKDVAGIATEMDAGEKAIIETNLRDSRRDEQTAAFDNLEDLIRAVALTLLDQHNTERTTVNALLTAIDNAANLADLKTAVAAIADLPTATPAQLKTAVRAKFGT